MDTVTYPDSQVACFIADNLIPLRLRSDSKPYSEQFHITWTPTLIILDPDNGREHQRTVGFLPPEELIPSLMLGIGKYNFDHDCFDEALTRFEQLLDLFDRSGSAPEAIFMTGVCGYKRSHDPKPLKAAYERLSTEFPDSEWTKRALPYRLL